MIRFGMWWLSMVVLGAVTASGQLKSIDSYGRDFKSALTEYTAYVKAQPADTEAYNDRCDLHFFVGKFKESIADYDVYLKANPIPDNLDPSLHALSNLCQALLSSNEFLYVD